MQPDLSIVVVTYNSQFVVGGLLDSLPAALDGLPASVIVVDNGSSDETVKSLSGRQDCTVVVSENTGYAAGINRGVRASRNVGPILALNPDTRLDPGSVRTLVASMTSNGWGVVVPKILNPDGSLFRSLRREPSIANAVGLGFTKLPRLSEYVGRESEYATAHVVDWALGAAMLMSRECFNAVGGWDESYFLYSEETDFCLRARDLGFLTGYEPSAIAEHIGGQSGTSNETHVMQIVNRVRLFKRRHSDVQAWVYWGLTILSELTWIARGHRQSVNSVAALFRPTMRPAKLGCSDRILPR